VVITLPFQILLAVQPSQDSSQKLTKYKGRFLQILRRKSFLVFPLFRFNTVTQAGAAKTAGVSRELISKATTVMLHAPEKVADS